MFGSANFVRLLNGATKPTKVCGAKSYANGKPLAGIPNAAHWTNCGHGISTALAVPGKVAEIVAVADAHMG